MWRTATRPRWLLLLLVALLAATGMAALGNWQLARAREHGDDAQAKRLAVAPVELATLLGPRQPFPAAAADRPVTVSGRWEPAGQLLVPARWQAGTEGLWVLTPLRLADGSGIGVVRGWTPSADDPAAAAPPAAPVTVTGVLRPGEPGNDYEPGKQPKLPAGQVESIDPVVLIEHWASPLYTGYVVQTGLSPAGNGPALRPVPPTVGDARLALQNLSYAVQWWLFAAFGVFLWWRMVADDHRRRLSRAASQTPPSGPSGPPGPSDPAERPDPTGRPVTPNGTPAS